MSGSIRIGGAVLVAIIVVGGSLYARSRAETAMPQQAAIVTVAPERSYIEPTDSDGDGVSDWEESLTARTFEAITLATTTPTLSPSETYTPPTTFTGKFSEAFLKDYLQGKMAGKDYLNNPEELVGTAVKAVNDSAHSDKYTQLDITKIESSSESIRAYGNNISDIILRNPSANPNENEMVILQRALETNDASVLSALTPIRESYERIIRETMRVEVPSSLSVYHVNLLNAYASILADIEAMEKTFEDPLLAFARVKGYEKDVEMMYSTFQAISRELKKYDITYTSDESGAFFSLFKQ